NGSWLCDSSNMHERSVIESTSHLSRSRARINDSRLIAVAEPGGRLVVVARVLLGALAVEAVVGRRRAAATTGAAHLGRVALGDQQESEEGRGGLLVLLIGHFLGHCFPLSEPRGRSSPRRRGRVEIRRPGQRVIDGRPEDLTTPSTLAAR